MFVRWKRRPVVKRVWKRHPTQRNCASDFDAKARCWWNEPTGAWIKTAYLIRSVRTPDGPRQEYICRLGSFREGGENDRRQRDCFWDEAQWEVCYHVAEEERERIIASLVAVIPQPEPEEE
jgi:hypothetical protein